METTLKSRVLHAYKTEATWSDTDPVLKQGELAFSSDKYGYYKLGNGTSKWSELEYIIASSNDFTDNLLTKLNGIDTGANKYVLPVAGTSIGGVKSGTDITVDSNGNVSVKDDSHNHIISNIDGLQDALNSKVESVNGKSLSTNDYTTAEKEKLNGIASGAEVNQNAFSTIKINSTNLSADSKTDTLTITSGTNITLTPTANSDSFSIAATDTTYTIASGDNNGQVKVTPSSGDAYNVDVKGLKALAYKASLDKSDVGLGNVSNIDTTNASNISSGTLAVSYGGTGVTSLASGELLVGNGTDAITTRSIKNIVGKNNLEWSSSTTDIDIPTVNTLAYWDGRYNSTKSNLTYCVKGAFGNLAIKDSLSKSDVGLGNVDNKSSATIRGEITSSNVTTALGYTPAELDSNGYILSSQLPSYVDDVIEGYLHSSKFYKESAHTTEITGETGKIYVDLSNKKIYRWSGSAFVEISASLALGETSSTAYRGDRGKTAYTHSQLTSGNPHNVTKTDIGLGNVDNTSDADKPISTATQTALDGKASSTHNHDSTYLKLDGGIVTGTLVLSKSTDLSGNANNSPALIIGGGATANHIEIDNNEIQSKSDGITPTWLGINTDGGDVQIGKSGTKIILGEKLITKTAYLESQTAPSVGWYRIALISSYGNFIMIHHGGYSTGQSPNFTIGINVDYNSVSLKQIYGIKKNIYSQLRLVKKANGEYYLDIYQDLEYASNTNRSFECFTFIGVGSIVTYTPTEPEINEATAETTCTLRTIKDTITLSATDGTNVGTSKTLDFSDDISIPLPSTINATFNGNLTGDVTGNITGDVTGDVTGNATTANGLKYITARPTSADPDTYGGGILRHFLASSSMTTNKPPTGDGVIIHLPWDNTGGYDSQIAIKNTTGQLAVRGMNKKTWGNWINILDSSNYSDYALPITGGTLRGDISVSKSDSECNVHVDYTGENAKKGSLIVNTNGNFGLYDRTCDKWVVKSDIDGNINLYGNANTATKLNTSKTIDGITFDGSISITHYGTCDTAANTQAKIVTCSGFSLETGARIYVKFDNAQTYNGAPTLNVNSTGAISVKRIGTTDSVRYQWQAGEVVPFVYDGTNWIIEGGGLATTRYYGKTQLNSSMQSTSTSVATTPYTINVLRNIINGYATYNASGTYAVGDRVQNGTVVYECNTAIETAEEWDATHWTALDTVQGQIDTVKSTYLPLSGGVMTGSINIGNNYLLSGNTKFFILPRKQYSDFGLTSGINDDFFKALLAWICTTYPNVVHGVWTGVVIPSGALTITIHIYDTNVVNSETGLPQYSDYTASLHNRDCYVGGTNNYNFSSARVYTSAYKPSASDVGALPLTGGTLTGTLDLTPASGEGGEIHLNASTANTTQNGIILDQNGGNLRIFGRASADGSTATGSGTPLVINPYSKKITGGYTITGSLTGHASLDLPLTGGTLTGSLVAKGNIQAGNSEQTGERRFYCESGAGALYLWCQGGSTGTRGLAFVAHGTGGWKGAVQADTNNNITFSGTLSGNASSATKIYSTYHAPTTAQTHYVPYFAGSGSENKNSRHNNSFMYLHRYGASNAIGYSILQVGNGTDYKTSGGTQGRIRIFGNGKHFVDLYAGNPTADRAITFPDKAGTVFTTGMFTLSGTTLTITTS